MEQTENPWSGLAGQGPAGPDLPGCQKVEELRKTEIAGIAKRIKEAKRIGIAKKGYNKRNTRIAERVDKLAG